MISTIVIAAAGRGTRMQALSADTPKHLIPVAGQPFLHFVLSSVRQAGFTTIVLVVGYKAELVRAFVADDGDIVVVDQTAVCGDKYGTAMPVAAAAAAVGQQPFVYQNGDSLYSQSAYRLVRQDSSRSRVLGAPHDHPEHYGVLDVAPDHRLRQIDEKPTQPTSNLINIGLYTFQPAIFSAVAAVVPSPRGEYELTDAVNVLAAAGQVDVATADNDWVDFGRPEDVAAVEQFIQRHHI